MAILGNIRKHPVFLVMIIGLALFAFVISGVLKSNGPSRNNIGSVNGENISSKEFSRRLGNTSSIQNVNSVWDALVKEKIYDEQIEKAGITVSEDDIWNSMINNPAYQSSPNFKNEEGLFDEDKLKEFIATMKSTPQGKQNWINAEKNIVNTLKQTTYDNLVQAGLTASLKEGKQFYASENTTSDIKYVYEPYATIKDEDVKVTDAEITTYINNHASEFKVEATREIEYVNFEVKPSKEDVAKVKNDLSKIINDFTDFDNNQNEIKVTGFAKTTDYASFVNDYSDVNYVDKVYFTNDLMTGVYDSIKNLPKGSIYGPYIDGDYYKLIKFLDKKNEVSVKSSHILLAYKGSASQKPDVTRTKEEAEKEAKKLLKQVNASNFAELAKANSDDSSASRGGELGGWYKEDGKLVKEYSDFIFHNKKGKIGMVETIFGYHIIKIDDVKSEPGLNLALITRKIDASQETESDIYQNAETFASDLIDGKDILELAKTNNYAIKKANGLTKLSESITGLGNQRNIVKWTFDKTTKIGDVKRFDLENSFAIVRLKNKTKKGLKSVVSSKPTVVPLIEKTKKAKIIKEKMIGNSLDEIAKSIGKSINSSNGVSITKPNLTVGGTDESIVGSLLYMKEGDIQIIEGKNGVYAIEMVKKNPLYDIKKYDTYSKNITTQLKSKKNQVFEAIKNIAKIDDQRAVFY